MTRSDTKRLIELRRLRTEIDRQIAQLETRILERIIAGTPRDAAEALGTQRRRAARCGTESGYRAHRRRGEKTCRACKDAHAEDRRDTTARRRARDAA